MIFTIILFDIFNLIYYFYIVIILNKERIWFKMSKLRVFKTCAILMTRANGLKLILLEYHLNIIF